MNTQILHRFDADTNRQAKHSESEKVTLQIAIVIFFRNQIFIISSFLPIMIFFYIFGALSIRIELAAAMMMVLLI